MCVKASGVPQSQQKLRVAFGVELKLPGSPRNQRKFGRFTVNQVTNGAPLVRRQIEQWQLVRANGSPVTS